MKKLRWSARAAVITVVKAQICFLKDELRLGHTEVKKEKPG